MGFNISIDLKKPSKVYHPGEEITGKIIANNDGSGDLKHDGINLLVEGFLTILTSPKTVGLIDTFVNSPKPILLHTESVDVCKGGKFSPGCTEIPFQISLPPSSDKKPIYETFHGSCIDVQYYLRCTMKRSILAKPVVAATEFTVEQKPSPDIRTGKPVKFRLSPENVGSSVGERTRLPQFVISGQLDGNEWSLMVPLSGEVCIEQCSGGTVSSIELQLHRVEVCGHQGDVTTNTEVSEVQGWQICDGNIARNLSIGFYLPLPKTFTCVTTVANNFSLGFQISLLITFNNDHQVRKNFPITFTR